MKRSGSSRRPRSGEGGVRGDLATLSLAEISQTLSLGAKTARLTLRNGPRQGQVWFEEGEPRHAVVGDIVGERAFYVMLAWKAGEFEIDHGFRTRQRSLPDDAMYLVLEGMRRLDEAGADLRGEHEPEHPAPRPRRRVGWILVSSILLLAAVATGHLIWRSGGNGTPRSVAPALPALPGSAPLGSERAAAFLEEDYADRPWDWALPVEPPDVEPVEPPAEAVAAAAVDEVDLVEAAVELAAAIEPVAAAGDPDATVAGESASAALPDAYLSISGKSHVKSGHLSIRLDGAEVYSTRLAREANAAKHLFGRIGGKTAERFEELIPVVSGQYEIVARLDVDGKQRVFETTARVDVSAGATRRIHFVAGKLLGSPLTLEIEQP